MELWRPIAGWQGQYEVSDLGRVRSLDRQTANGFRRGRVLKPMPKAGGYLFVQLYKNGRQYARHIHALVLEAFTHARPQGMQVCHNNGDPTDNRLENLRWGTPKENHADMWLHGTRKLKTHCPQGHEYTDDNVYRSAHGSRNCKICSRSSQLKHRAARNDRRRKQRQQERRLNPIPPRQPNPELLASISSLRKGGMTMQSIADNIGCSIGLVHRYIHRYRMDG